MTPSLDTHDPKVIKLAEAIARAEGFYASNEPLPKRINNPLDLELGDKGYGTQAGKTVFNTIEEGWEAGYFEAWMMLTGNSHFYNPSKTFAQVATLYTGGDNPEAWAFTVSTALGLSPITTLQTYLNL